MTTANDARRAHKLLDHIANGYKANAEEVDRIRKFLPERPKDVTLDDLLTRVHDAWMKANPSDWGFDTPAEHHDWLFDLRNDLIRIIEEQDAPANIPALPAGMRIAEHENFGRVVVSPGVGIDRCHEIFYLDPGMSSGTDISEVEPDSLTFIDAEPAHPEFLETEADYQKAPEGTIVALDDTETVWLKRFGVWKSTDGDHGVTCVGLSASRLRVLRWGWSK